MYASVDFLINTPYIYSYMHESILDDSAIQLRSSGASLASIGAHYGVSAQAVRKFLRKRGLATSAISKHFCGCGKAAKKKIDGAFYCGKACWRRKKPITPAYREAHRRASRYISMANRSIGFANGDHTDASLPNIVAYDSPVIGTGQIVWRGSDMARLRSAHDQFDNDQRGIK